MKKFKNTCRIGPNYKISYFFLAAKIVLDSSCHPDMKTECIVLYNHIRNIAGHATEARF